jgi:transposase-like protein
VILAGFVLGLSTRKVGEAQLALLGRLVSASTVSQVAKTLDAAVTAFHRRPLQNRYQALMLDGVVLSRKTGAGALRRPVLVALGLRHDGKKEIIDFRLVAGESAAESECSIALHGFDRIEPIVEKLRRRLDFRLRQARRRAWLVMA